MIDRRRHKFWIRATVIIIFVLACAHRLIGLGQVPEPHATNDEFDYMWAGTAMVHGESPIGWSFFNPREYNFLGIYMINKVPHDMHRPFLDHPPVFQILAGITTTLAGAQQKTVSLLKTGKKATLYETSLEKLRLLPLVLFMFSFWLLWYWLRLISDEITALIAVSIYSFVEIIVIHQRLVVPDNLMAPLTLATFVVLELWRRQRLSDLTTGSLVTLFVGLIIGTKTVGLMLVPAILFWGTIALDLKYQKMQTLKWSLAGILLGLLIVVGTGALLDWSAFVATMKAQSGRFVNFNGMFQMIGISRMIDTPVYNGWILGGWILIFMSLKNSANRQLVAFSCIPIALLTGLAFFAPRIAYGWYGCTFFPFIAAAWAFAVRRAWRVPSVPASAVTLVLLAAAGLTSLMDVLPFGSSMFRFSYLVIAAVAYLPWLTGAKAYRQILRAGLFTLLLLGLYGELLSFLGKVI